MDDVKEQAPRERGRTKGPPSKTGREIWLAPFLPSLVDVYLRSGASPLYCRLTTLFVDIAGSTSLLVRHPPETVLAIIQRFMRLVTEIALAHHGDVKDFEGDGALLYFGSAAHATQAALAIQAAFSYRRYEACEATDQVTPRMSLTVGDVVVGIVGSTMRQAIALVGRSVSVGARLLKQIPPGAIIASGELVEALRAEAPVLAEEFRLLDSACQVSGADGISVTTYVAPCPKPCGPDMSLTASAHRSHPWN
ncbi:MAG: hypothetical protein HYZ81_15935 [Nitrospinae bacterium]|nr:hypothetical protein [Nitrospinota bacterium]